MDIKKTISKIFKRITKNHSLFQSQQETQATEGTNEKLRSSFRSQKIRSTFYTKNTLPKLIFKLIDWVAAEVKTTTFIKLTIVTAKQIPVMNLNNTKDLPGFVIVKKNGIGKHRWEAAHNFGWDQNKVADWESRLTPKKTKETMHFLRNSNQIN